MKVQYRTPEERAKIIAQVVEAKNKENLTTEAACDKVGVNLHTYYNWTRGKKTKGKRKYTKRKAKMETALVAITPPEQTVGENFRQSFGGKVEPFQIAEMLATMNAHSLRTLLQGVVR